LVAQYLLANPDFFERHTQVLSRLTLSHTVGDNTISLQAKQVRTLREQLSMHEAQLNTLLANARNSESIAKGLHTVTLSLLAQRSVRRLPMAGQEALAHVFGLQDSAVRLWGTEALYETMPCNQAVGEDIKTFADGLKQPYSGPNANFSVTHWLERKAASLAMVALRVTPNSPAFGLLVIGSPDPNHFTLDKSTDFLAQLGHIYSASLGRMLPAYS
jgi:uncharacterized protein YigA (DUF484 family)